MEILLILALSALIVKGGVGDMIWAARGKPSPLDQRKAKRAGWIDKGLDLRAKRLDLLAGKSPRAKGTTPWQAYRRALVNDTWTTALHRHNRQQLARLEKRIARQAGEIPPGAARTFARRLGRRGLDKWDASWNRLSDRLDRRTNTLSPEPDPPSPTEPTNQSHDGRTESQPEIPPAPDFNAQVIPFPRPPKPTDTTDLTADSDEQGEANPDRANPTSDTTAESLEDTSPTDITRGDTESTTSADADETKGAEAGGPNGESPENSPGSQAGNRIEGETPMSGETGEVTGLASALAYVQAMTQKANEAATSVETAMADLQNGGVTGPTIQALATGQEHMTAAAQDFDQAAQELQRHMQVAEAYEANPDAGQKEFVTAE